MSKRTRAQATPEPLWLTGDELDELSPELREAILSMNLVGDARRYDPECFNATVWFGDDGDEELVDRVPFYYIIDEDEFLEALRRMRETGFVPVRMEINGHPVELSPDHLWTPLGHGC